MSHGGFRYQPFTFLANLFGMFDSQVSEHGRGAALTLFGLIFTAEQTPDRTRAYGAKEAPDHAPFTDISPDFRLINTQHSRAAVGQNHVQSIPRAIAVKKQIVRVILTVRYYRNNEF